LVKIRSKSERKYKHELPGTIKVIIEAQLMEFIAKIWSKTGEYFVASK
jgi:hypothetical protein